MLPLRTVELYYSMELQLQQNGTGFILSGTEFDISANAQVSRSVTLYQHPEPRLLSGSNLYGVVSTPYCILRILRYIYIIEHF